jgi:3-methylcrotonyl-CoA carboxylase alpha subunit
VRVDGGVIEGDTVTIFYDPMIAKLIVWDRTRADALQRMREALAATRIVGPKSNVEFLERLVRHPTVTGGTIDTGYLDRHLDEFLPPPAQTPDPVLLAAAAAAVMLDEEAQAPRLAATGSDPHSPWARADGWRLGHPGKRVVALVHAGHRVEATAYGAAGRYTVDVEGRRIEVENALLSHDGFVAQVDGATHRWGASVDAGHVLLHDGDVRHGFERAQAFAYTATATGGGDRVGAPMPGRVVLVKCRPGDVVTEGQELAIMEAMKMEITLRAPRAGTIAAVQAAAGDFVEADAVLIRLEAP